MSNNLYQQTTRLTKALAIALLIAAATSAFAQKFATPSTPAAITVPAGNELFLFGHATGTQGYVCLPKGEGASWTMNASRPQATLHEKFLGFDVNTINHFLSPDTNPNQNAPVPLPFGSPTWQSGFDGSVVWAKALTPNVPAGTDQSCPNSGAIPCLLLQSIGTQQGPNGGKLMTNTTYIQRLNTTGGAAPATGCSASTDVGKQVLVPYTADYYFYRAD